MAGYVFIVWCSYRYKGDWVKEVHGIFRDRVAAEMWAEKFWQEYDEKEDWDGTFLVEKFPVSSFTHWRHPAHGDDYGDDYGDDDYEDTEIYRSGTVTLTGRRR